LAYLEELIGADVFRKFMKSYFTKFADQSITAEDMRSEFEVIVSEWYGNTANNFLDQIDWDAWLLAPGLPPVTMNFWTPEQRDSSFLAHDYIRLAGESPQDFEDYFNFLNQQKDIFIEQLLNRIDELTVDILKRIDEDLKLSESLNHNTLYIWYQLAVSTSLIKAPYGEVVEYLGSIGRMKYIVPVYSALNRVDSTAAHTIFESYKGFYHPIAIDSIKKAIGTQSKASEYVSI
jgi:leukotriene-A4 hydrolase